MSSPDAQPSARYIMIGGFLGAGKTTAVARLATWLTAKGQRVGLITNDQGSHLVDTTMLVARGFSVEEIPGGCFCCRFNSLVDAAKRLTAQSRPDVFVAEPVGSCTDLLATVSYPLRKLYANNFSIAPLSAMIDPIRAMRVLGLAHGGSFSDKVVYIYRKQLEEAEVIVINKCDLITAEQSMALKKVLRENFPRAQLFDVSARQGIRLDPWFEYITSTILPPKASVDVDYAVYADGEARLGWLNGTLRLEAKDCIDGNQLVKELAAEIQRLLNAAGAEVAHLKMTLDADSELGDLAVVNLVRNDFIPELSQNLHDSFVSGELTINLRAEAAPDKLLHGAKNAVDAYSRSHPMLTMRWAHLESFQPNKPQPTHRIALVA